MAGIFMYAVEMGSGGFTYIKSFMTTDFGIQGILSSLPPQFECWYYKWDKFI
jgi:hypothetical protein